MAAQPGTLYLVGTPIGNLQDLTLRALTVLRDVDLIAAEDTRITRRLTKRHDIRTPLISYHQHSGKKRADQIAAILRDGKDVALVCDAGMPGFSDPGAQLVTACVAEGIPVAVVPGPTASSAALAVSGFSGRTHVFLGFLPTKRGERRKALARVADQRGALVFYEAPHRLLESLSEMRQVLGDREAACARELTKRFEQVVRGPLSELEEHFSNVKPRGEFTIVVQGAAPVQPETGLDEAAAEVEDLLAAGLSRSRAVAHVAKHRGLSRNKLYLAVTKGRE